MAAEEDDEERKKKNESICCLFVIALVMYVLITEFESFSTKPSRSIQTLR